MPTTGNRRGRPAVRARYLLPALILLVYAWTQLAAIPRDAPTVDEQAHLARGLVFARTGDLRLYIGHPPLVNVIAALPVLADPRVRLPLDDPSWAARDWIEFPITLFWKTDNPALTMFAAGRVMIVLLGALLLAVVYRLGADVGGPAAGAAAMLLAALDPTLRAHARLITTDVGVTLALALTLLVWRRWLRGPRPALAVAAGAALGLALLSKYTANLFVPALIAAALAAWGLRRRTTWLRVAAALAVAGLVVWSLYRFEARPVFGLAWPVPLATYWDEFVWSATELAQTPSYLFGRIMRTGALAYFPVALGVKMPLPLLGLALGGLALWLRRAWRAEVVLWLPALTYFGLAIVAGVNIGYRHLLPILPALYVAAGWALARLITGAPVRRALALGLAGWLAVNAALVYPRDLTFFNELAGGPDNGWRVLVDSNLDWGQDLGELVDFARSHQLTELYVSYFGSVPIGSFAVDEFPLPARPLPPRPSPDWQPLFPAPGWYAISVTHLVGGAVLDDPDTFAFFRHQQPVAVLGRTIYVYHIPAETGTLAQCVNPPPSLAPSEVRRIFEAALTRQLPFDCTRGLPLPAGRTWYLLRGEQTQPVEAALRRLGATLLYDTPNARDPAFAFRLYRLDDAAGRAAAYPERPNAATFGGRLTFQGSRYTQPLQPGRPAQVETVWRLEAPLPEPASLFLHLTAADGFPLAVSDGLNTPSDQLQPGDALIQFHPLDEYPPQLPEGAQFRVGAYPLRDPAARYQLATGEDAVLFFP